jgi:HAD superfamily hydrolase (TIGR01509 family)
LQDVQHGKPHPETFLKAAALIGVEPQHCVGYEDAKLGMEAIKAAGFLQAIDVTEWAGYPKLV